MKEFYMDTSEHPGVHGSICQSGVCWTHTHPSYQNHRRSAEKKNNIRPENIRPSTSEIELVAQAIRRRQVYLLPYMEWDWDCEVEGDLGERRGCFQPDDSYISTWTPIAQEKDTQPHVSSFKSTDDEKADAHGFRGSLESNECIVCIYALTTICLHCETSS